MKAGVELSNISANQTFPNNKDGTFNFLTDTSTLPNTASIAVGFTDPNGISDAKASATAVTTGVYVNDEWRMAENFTLSLGVRHDAEFNTMNNKYTVPWASDPVLQGLPDLQGLPQYRQPQESARQRLAAHLVLVGSDEEEPDVRARRLRNHLRSRHELHRLPGAQELDVAHVQLHEPGHERSRRAPSARDQRSVRFARRRS